VVCIGATTAQAARKLGVRVDRIASTPSLEAVRDALSEARNSLSGVKHA
jgi:uroporphyrinogen-III synthase